MFWTKWNFVWLYFRPKMVYTCNLILVALIQLKVDYLRSSVCCLTQQPRQRSPPLFPNLSDAGCVCWASYNRVPLFHASKKSLVHASYHSQNLYMNRTRCRVLFFISKFIFGQILTVWNWSKMDLELVSPFFFSRHFFLPLILCAFHTWNHGHLLEPEYYGERIASVHAPTSDGPLLKWPSTG